MKFCVLASGSRGNAIWVEEGGLAVVLDCGLSAIEFKRRADEAGLDLSKLGCVLVSHEHRDHIGGLGPLTRKHKIPALANQATRDAAEPMVGAVKWQIFTTGDTLNLGPIRVRTIPISHDAADPVAFLLESDSGSLGVATDLGVVTHIIREKFRGLRSLILEFNHDFHALMEGPYPWPLKQRVKSRIGHLSNEDAAQLAAELYHQDLKHLVLAHLSETNNRPELALKAAQEALEGQLEPEAASQWRPTKVFEF